MNRILVSFNHGANVEPPEESLFLQHHSQVTPISGLMDLAEELHALWFDHVLNCTTDAALVL
ncbi:MAG: hypothetical protein ABGY32_10865 [bacterium]